MSSATSIRPKTSQSRIPVPVRNIPKTSQSRMPVPVRNMKSANMIYKEKGILFGKKPISLSQTSNVIKVIPKNTHHIQNELVKTSCSQSVKSDKTPSLLQSSNTIKIAPKHSLLLQNDLAKKSCSQSGKSEKAPSVLQTSNANKIVPKNSHFMQKEVTKISSSQSKNSEKAPKERNIKNSKCKFTSSRENAQSAIKVRINSEDDIKKKQLTPKVVLEKENKVTSNTNCFSAQKDIKFEASEFYRNMILSGRELSPSICKLMPGLKFSYDKPQRPSAYQKFEICPDPYKEALQAIANLSAKRDRKMSSVKEKKILSPFRDRNSFYTPCADPKLEVMRSLEALKAKQLQKSALKSTKKVTFNLNIEECTQKNVCDSKPTSCKNTGSRLTQINENSKENTPHSPSREMVESVGVKLDEDSKQTSEFQKNDSSVQEAKAANQTDKLEKHINSSVCGSSKLCIPVSKSIFTTVPKNVDQRSLSPVECADFYSLKESDAETLSSNFNSDNMRFISATSTKSQRTPRLLCSMQNNMNDENVERTTHAKVYTPKPISYFSKSILTVNCTPEFLITGASPTLSNLAPIYTPLVLKSIAKSSEFSPHADNINPVRLKLDFTETEKDTPKKETSVKNGISVTRKKIETMQQKLDDLADQECSVWLVNESISVVCGRYLQNPVALTLSEGDEMHFIPIRL